MSRAFVLSCFPIPKGIKYHDSWFACCALITKNAEAFKFVHTVLTRYRQHGDNNSGDKLRPDANCIQKLKRIRRLPEVFRVKVRPNTDCVTFIPALLRKCNFKDNAEAYRILKNSSKFVVAMAKKKLRILQFPFAWTNYDYIVTEKGHPDFLGWLGRWMII